MEHSTWTHPATEAKGELRPISTIVCEKCGSLGFSCLTYAEAEAILSDGRITRHCQVCGAKTMWGRLDKPWRRAAPIHS